jgi:hypothetical protein
MYTERKRDGYQLDLQAEFTKQLQRIALEKSKDFEKSLQDIIRKEGELIKRRVIREAVHEIMSNIFSNQNNKSFAPPPTASFTPIIKWLGDVWD